MSFSFNLSETTDLLKDFYALTGIRVSIFDENLNILCTYPEKSSPVCELIKETKEGKIACENSDKKALRIAKERGETLTYRCHAGLTESIVPIKGDHKIFCYILLGQILSYPSQDIAFNKIREKCQDINLNPGILKREIQNLPLKDKDYITASCNIIKTVCTHLFIDLSAQKNYDVKAKLMEYLNENYVKDIDAKDIADHFDMGKTKLYELAKDALGMGIAEYIRNLRVNKAMDLLKNKPQLPLKEVAKESGFKDYNYFITVFKKVTGLSPRNYQKNPDNIKENK